MSKWTLLGAVLLLFWAPQVNADCGDGPMYWCDSCATVKQCSFLLKDMIKVCMKIGLLTEQDCPELIFSEEATSLPPTNNPITAEPPTMSADDLPDVITEKVIQQILTEAYRPAMGTVARTNGPAMATVARTTEQTPEEEVVATDFPYGVTEADGDFRNPVVDTWTADPTRKTCSVFGRGDVYVSTFNMETYGFSGDCTYVLSVDCTERRRDWLVYGTIGQCPQGKCLNGLTLFYKGLSLLVDRAWTVSYQGSVLKLLEDYPVYFYEFQLDFDGSNLRILMPNDMSVNWNGLNSVQITAPSNGDSCGMCGSFGDPDSLRTRANEVVDSYIDIVESWKVDRLKTCPDTTGPTTTKKEMCGEQPRNAGKLYCQAMFTGDDQGCPNKRWYEERCVNNWCNTASTSPTDQDTSLISEAECEVLDVFLRSCGKTLERDATRCPSEAEVQGYTLLEKVAPWHEEYDGMKM